MGSYPLWGHIGSYFSTEWLGARKEVPATTRWRRSAALQTFRLNSAATAMPCDPRAQTFVDHRAEGFITPLKQLHLAVQDPGGASSR